MPDLNPLKLPALGKYTRKAIDHPDLSPGIRGRVGGSIAPRTKDPEAIDILIVDSVAPDPLGRDVIGRVQFCNMDEFRNYSTSLPIFSEAGWELQEEHGE